MRVGSDGRIESMRLFRNGERVVHKRTGLAGKIIKIKVIVAMDGTEVRKYIVYFSRNNVHSCIYTDLELDVLGELAR